MSTAVTNFYLFISTKCGNWENAVSCIDTNGDNIITKGELRTFLSGNDTFEYSATDFEDIWGTLDTHKKGSIGNGNVKNLNALDSSEQSKMKQQIEYYGKVSGIVEKALRECDLDFDFLNRIGGEDKLKYAAVTLMLNENQVKQALQNGNLEYYLFESLAKNKILEAAKDLIHEALTNYANYTCFTNGLPGSDGQTYKLEDDENLKDLIDSYLNTVTLDNLNTDVIDNVAKIIEAYLKGASLGTFAPDMDGLDSYQWDNTQGCNQLQIAQLTKKYKDALKVNDLIGVPPFDKFASQRAKLQELVNKFIKSEQEEWTNPSTIFENINAYSEEAIRDELDTYIRLNGGYPEVIQPNGDSTDPPGDNPPPPTGSFNINENEFKDKFTEFFGVSDLDFNLQDVQNPEKQNLLYHRIYATCCRLTDKDLTYEKFDEACGAAGLIWAYWYDEGAQEYNYYYSFDSYNDIERVIDELNKMSDSGTN